MKRKKDAAYVSIGDAELTEKLMTLRDSLAEYDAGAKAIYKEMKHVNFGAFSESFEELGEYIENYEFGSAERICSGIIKEIEKRMSGE